MPCGAGFAAAAAQERDPSLQHEYPLVGDEGQQVPNHTVKLLGPIDRLPGVVVVGNLHGEKTLTEFYDLNCPIAAQHPRPAATCSIAIPS